MKTLLRRYGAPTSVAVALTAFALGFVPLYRLLGPATGSLVVIPVLTAAWSYRLRTVLLVAAVSGLLFPLEYLAAGNLNGADPRTALVTTGALAAIGWILHYARAAQRRITKLTATDRATGLLTRTAFVHALDATLRAEAATSADVLLIQIVDLRQLTEIFGHVASEELLGTIGQRLRAVAGSELVARIDADSFLILLPAGTTPMRSAESMHAAITESIEIAGTELQLEAKVAVARYPIHGRDADELVRRLEIALDDATTKGHTTAVATARSEQERLSRVDTFVGLRAALANDELRLYYQPIVELPSEKVTGVEALVRWQHPTRGLLAPSEFIPVAEQSGLIVPLTEWLLGEALRQSRAWSDEGLTLQVAVNIPAKALAGSAKLPAALGKLLRMTGAAPERLTLEVTESDVMGDVERAGACLDELKAFGVRIDIDDFGTGYSSLSYLQKLPVDAVKIDRSFITPLFVDASTSAIVRAAIELSHALGLETIAEGVEDQAVIEMLGAMGCDYAQGHVFAHPMAPDAFVDWLSSRTVAGQAEPEAPSDPTLFPAATIVQLPRPTATLPAGSRGTVLVVDDEHPFRVSAHRILSDQGYTVLHAATASEALRICATERHKIDLVLTDIFLTDWQGDQLGARLRETYPDLRVMFMSGDPSGSRLAGADPFLAKPFSRQQLIAGVARALAA